MTALRLATTLRSLAAATLFVAAASNVASALPVGQYWRAGAPSVSVEAATVPPRAENVRLAQDSCSAAALEAAAQTGGQVLSVSMTQKGGQTVCVVTVLIPGHSGDRPRRTTVTVPL